MRERLATPEGKAKYKLRKQTVESVIGQAKSARPYRQRPPWVQFLEDGFPNSVDWRQSQGLEALLVLETRRGQQVLNFALAFGQSGRNLVRDAASRRRWGLRAALNFLTDPLNPPRLRAFDTVRHGPSILRSRLQSTSLANLGTFELDVFRDLIRNAVGKPADNAFGVRVGGANALQIPEKYRLIVSESFRPDGR